MPKTLQEIIDHADDMSAAAFEHHLPDPAAFRDPGPLLRTRTAVQARAQAEADVAAAVADMRGAGYSWAAIGMVLGTTGEAARQRYGEATAESVPAPRASRPPSVAAKTAKAPRPTPTRATARVSAGEARAVKAASGRASARPRRELKDQV